MTSRVLRLVLIGTALLAVAAMLGACATTPTEPGKSGRSGPTGTAPGAEAPSGETSGAAGAGSAAGTAVTIQDFRFDPPTLAVRPGTTVKWTNNDTTAHTVTSDTFGSGQIEPGDTYSHTFRETGTFAYRCNLHPEMRGKVVVR